MFFADAKWPGQPKIARALSGFIEAYGVEPVYSGGVKKDHVRHSLGDQSGGGTAEGYGTVPYQRTEWTAEQVVACFSLDRRQLHSYGLGDEAADLLEAIALWEVRTLVEGSLRLRTACDFEPMDDELRDQDGEPIPAVEALEQRIRDGIRRCESLLGGGAIDVVWSGSSRKKS